MSSQHAATRSPTLLNKVPEVTVYFWLIKVLCTTVGETAVDFLNGLFPFESAGEEGVKIRGGGVVSLR